MQLAFTLANTWSRQAWLQAMQVLISSSRPVSALRTQSGSARNGRAIETRSASPRASTSSATCGMLIRFEVTTGMPTCAFSLAVISVNAARGTDVTMVGTRASCQPMPVLMMLAPACSTSLPRATTSSQVWPPSTRSAIDRRYTMRKSAPAASRDLRTISVAIRRRFSGEPPQESVRLLVRSARNWLMK